MKKVQRPTSKVQRQITAFLGHSTLDFGLWTLDLFFKKRLEQ